MFQLMPDLTPQMKNQNQFSLLLKANSIGSTARLVCSQCTKGKVLASVTDTIYLESEAGDLFWIIGENEPLHWRSICVQGLVPRITTGSEAAISSDHIVFDDGLKINLSDAVDWSAKFPDSSNLFSINSLFQKTRETYAELATVPRNGFGNLIPAILSNMNDPAKENKQEFQDPILRQAWTHVQDIVLESSRHNFNIVLERAESLLGLGAGLTPSGDDFIGGLLFTFHFLGNAYAEQVEFNPKHLEEFLARSGLKTNLISFTLMRDMSMGHGLAPLHEVMNSIVTNQPNDHIITQAFELAKVGNSTGWDILTGVLAGLLSTLSYARECH